MIFSIWGSSEAELSGTLFKVAFQIGLFLTLLLFEMAVLCNLFCAAGGSAIGILLSMLCVIGLIIADNGFSSTSDPDFCGIRSCTTFRNVNMNRFKWITFV